MDLPGMDHGVLGKDDDVSVKSGQEPQRQCHGYR